MPYNSVFRALTMVVAKSEARRDTTVYFRTARPWPSLVTALGLGYFTVRTWDWRAALTPKTREGKVRARGGGGGGGYFCARAQRLPRFLVYAEVRWALGDFLVVGVPVPESSFSLVIEV